MKNQFLSEKATYFILGFALITLFLGSCKKDGDGDDVDDSSSYIISFKLNGELQKFADENFPPSGSFYDDGTQYSGLFAATGYATSIGFQVYDTNAIVEKDYSGLVITPTSGHNSLYGAVVSYTNGQDSYSTQSVTNPTVHIKITEITSTSVRGEFSGTLKSQNGKADVVITEGKFFVSVN